MRADASRASVAQNFEQSRAAAAFARRMGLLLHGSSEVSLRRGVARNALEKAARLMRDAVSPCEDRPCKYGGQQNCRHERDSKSGGFHLSNLRCGRTSNWIVRQVGAVLPDAFWAAKLAPALVVLFWRHIPRLQSLPLRFRDTGARKCPRTTLRRLTGSVC
jgi:hypothetical protein